MCSLLGKDSPYLKKNGLYTNFGFLGRVLRITCLRIRDFNDSALNLVKFNNIKGYNVQMVYSFAISGFVQVNLFHKKSTEGVAMSPGDYITAGKE